MDQPQVEGNKPHPCCPALSVQTTFSDSFTLLLVERCLQLFQPVYLLSLEAFRKQECLWPISVPLAVGKGMQGIEWL